MPGEKFCLINEMRERRTQCTRVVLETDFFQEHLHYPAFVPIKVLPFIFDYRKKKMKKKKKKTS